MTGKRRPMSHWKAEIDIPVAACEVPAWATVMPADPEGREPVRVPDLGDLDCGSMSTIRLHPLRNARRL